MIVLGIDDDPDDLSLLNDAIRIINPTIIYITASNCIKALKMLEGDRLPDFIFLDINMPGITGINFLKIIRKNPKFDGVPVTVMSTHISHEDIETCKLNRAGYLIKPANFDVFVQEIERVLNPTA